MRGRRVLITGASGGIGAPLARALAAAGADLVLVGRSAPALEQLAATLPAAGSQHHQAEVLDVADDGAWRDAADRLAPDGRLDGLVAAAGVLGPVGPAGSWSVAEFRAAVEVNLVGTVIPILALLDALTVARGAVVTYSGGGATAPLPRFDAYAASKAAVVRLTENLAADLAAAGVRINSVAPGFVATDIHRTTLAAGPDRAGAAYFERTARALTGDGADPPDLAVALTLFLLSEAASGITGRLISARWDPWSDPAFQGRLRREPDLATLRRIDDQFYTTAVRGE